MNNGDYSIGSNKWNGLSKCIEEAGELILVMGKLIGSNGDTNHYSGDLSENLKEELADVFAAVTYFIEKNYSDEDIDLILDRADRKKNLYHIWNNENK